MRFWTVLGVMTFLQYPSVGVFHADRVIVRSRGFLVRKRGQRERVYPSKRRRRWVQAGEEVFEYPHSVNQVPAFEYRLYLVKYFLASRLQNTHLLNGSLTERIAKSLVSGGSDKENQKACFLVF